MLEIVSLAGNPRKKTIIDPITKKRVKIKSGKMRAGGTVTRNGKQVAPGLSKHWLAQQALLNKNPAKKKRKRKIIRAKKNPLRFLQRKTIIVGYLDKQNRTPGKRVYYTDHQSFSRYRYEAKEFPGDRAKKEAQRIQTMLPDAIYGIRVENA